MKHFALLDEQIVKLEYILNDYIDRVLEGDVEGHGPLDAGLAMSILESLANQETPDAINPTD